ncbi:putative transporter [Clavispora lusitaniae]|uniref:Transporter n=1 Tax=Clavispora lusitaniae TaxID=36911 RepID=A0AA91Q490_CLALS|nr:putative transporter [Clavispora lusitaniae]
MLNDSVYLTTHETALAVVATAMKKARLSIDTLIINSFMGGVFFSTGGMLFVLAQANSPKIYESDPGMINLIQGILYPIGLFYVVITGVDLFNSNILFFAVGVARGAVTIVDLLISWLVSWWFNLVGNIFVCYIICHYSGVSSQPLYVKGSVDILKEKLNFSFTETLLKGMAGNFYVCLAIYLQLMAKPLHVKFLMMLLPIFSFVSMGFTHSVADMYMIICGLINDHSISVRTVAWKLFLPGALGNIIGGTFFALVVPWYLHLYVVERDQRALHLPRFEMRDEQPELNQDSRVVRVRPEDMEDDDTEIEQDRIPEKQDDGELSSIGSSRSPSQYLDRTLSRATTTRSQRQRRLVQSPSNVFPVLGMGPPASREKSIVSGEEDEDEDMVSTYSGREIERPSANFIGEQIKRTLSRQPTKKDIEAQHEATIVRDPESRRSSINFPRQLHRFSFAHDRANSARDLAELNKRFDKAGITQKAADAANEAAGTSDFLHANRASPIMKMSSGIPPETKPVDATDMEPTTTTASTIIKPYKPEEADS